MTSETTSAAKTILICEDDENLRELMRIAVGPQYRCVEASDGQEVVDLVHELDPDLVLLDLMLPGKTGFDILAELHAQRAADRPPVVVVTAWSHDRDAVLDAGADRFVAKPFVPDDLRTIVEELLEAP